MSKVQTKLFMSNKSQAVRLPKGVAYPASVQEVDIIAIGNKRVIVPSCESWDSWFDDLPVTDDFMSARHQPVDQSREELEC